MSEFTDDPQQNIRVLARMVLDGTATIEVANAVYAYAFQEYNVLPDGSSYFRTPVWTSSDTADPAELYEGAANYLLNNNKDLTDEASQAVLAGADRALGEGGMTDRMALRLLSILDSSAELQTALAEDQSINSEAAYDVISALFSNPELKPSSWDQGDMNALDTMSLNPEFLKGLLDNGLVHEETAPDTNNVPLPTPTSPHRSIQGGPQPF